MPANTGQAILMSVEGEEAGAGDLAVVGDLAAVGQPDMN